MMLKITGQVERQEIWPYLSLNERKRATPHVSTFFFSPKATGIRQNNLILSYRYSTCILRKWSQG